MRPQRRELRALHFAKRIWLRGLPGASVGSDRPGVPTCAWVRLSLLPGSNFSVSCAQAVVIQGFVLVFMKKKMKTNKPPVTRFYKRFSRLSVLLHRLKSFRGQGREAGARLEGQGTGTLSDGSLHPFGVGEEGGFKRA